MWDNLARMGAEERAVTRLGASQMTRDAEAPWLARVEEAATAHAQDPAIAAAAGTLYAQRQLWGKARPALEQAARANTLNDDARRRAWHTLADLARAQGDDSRAQDCEHQARSNWGRLTRAVGCVRALLY